MDEDYPEITDAGPDRGRTNPAGTGPSASQTINRWQFRADQVQLLYQQVQVELIISMLVVVMVSFIFWRLAPPALLLSWAIAIIITVGGRSLFISGKSDEGTLNEVSLWGSQYVTGAMISGIAWGGLGVIAAIFGDFTHQLFALFVLAGICLTAYVSMQSSPKTTAAFVLPALLPINAWFFYQGGQLEIVLSITSVIFALLMLTSSRTMRNILAKSYSLGSHNTELIRKLIGAREVAENSKKNAERANVELQEQIKEKQLAQERIHASEQKLSAVFDSMQDTIYQTNINGKILWTTPSVSQLLGYRNEEIIGRNIKEFYVDPEHYNEFKEKIEANYGRIQHFETRLLHKNGKAIWISENSHFKYNVSGEITGIEGTIRDITVLKQTKSSSQYSGGCKKEMSRKRCIKLRAISALFRAVSPTVFSSSRPSNASGELI